MKLLIAFLFSVSTMAQHQLEGVEKNLLRVNVEGEININTMSNTDGEDRIHFEGTEIDLEVGWKKNQGQTIC